MDHTKALNQETYPDKDQNDNFIKFFQFLGFGPNNVYSDDLKLVKKLIYLHKLMNNENLSFPCLIILTSNLLLNYEEIKLKLKDAENLKLQNSSFQKIDCNNDFVSLNEEINKKQQQIIFFRNKSNEYKAQCKKIDKELQGDGFIKSLANLDKIAKQTQDLDDIHKKIDQLQGIIEQYKELPFDTVLAKLKLENALNRLTILKHEFNIN